MIPTFAFLIFTLFLGLDADSAAMQHTSSVGFLQFSHDGRSIMAYGTGRVIRIWDLKSGNFVDVGPFDRAITSLGICRPTGDVYAVDYDGYIFFYSVKEKQLSEPRRLPVGHRFQTFLETPTPVIMKESSARLFDFVEAKDFAFDIRLSHHARSVAYSRESRLIAFGVWDWKVTVADLKGNIKTEIDMQHRGTLTSFSNDGKYVCYRKGKNGFIVVNVNSVAQRHSIPRYLEAADPIFSPDGKIIVAACATREIIAYSTKTGEEIFVLNGSKEPCFCMAFSPCGRYLIHGGVDRLIWIWDIKETRYISRSEVRK